MPTDQEITDRVQANMGLVGRQVNRTLRLFPRLPGGYERDDVQSLGNLGLVRAAQTFDPARGVRFSTYASRCIEKSIAGRLSRESVREIDCTSFTQPGRDEDEASIEDEIVDAEADTAGLALQQCNREILASEIAALPVRYADVLQAIYFQGNTVGQVAASWCRTTGAVEFLHRQALKALRRRLHGLGFR